ncbi:MAG: hypothetical protein ACI83B_000697 [Sediminicola sp.]|jgi:hypothetical protein
MLDQSIVILLTPYHIQALKDVCEKFDLAASELIILMPDSLNSSLLDTFKLESIKIIRFSSKDYQLAGERFGKRVLSIIKNPFYIKKLRTVFNNTKDLIDKSLCPILRGGDKQLVIFNDRDFMAQVAISKLRKKFRNSISIVAIDEGLGFYVKEGIKESTMKLVYNIISPFLFGFNYRFIEQYGSHPQINLVYARFPELIIKKSHIKYHKIPFDLNSKDAFNISKIKSSRSILLISAPLTEENFISIKEEINFYKFLGIFIKENNLNLTWKPHPREGKNKISDIVNKYLKNDSNIKFELVEKNVLAEEIDYATHGAIITFGSSIILDLIYRGYPRDSIVTIKPYNFYLTEHIFDQTRLINIDNNLNLNLEKRLNDIF